MEAIRAPADLDATQLTATAKRKLSPDSALRRLLALGDVVAVTAALVAAIVVPPVAPGGHEVLWGLIAMPVMLVLFKLYGLYDRDVKRISHSTVDDLPYVFHATVIGALVLWLYSRYTPLRRLDFIEVLEFGVTSVVFVLLARFCLRAVAARAVGRERVLLVGGGEMASALLDKLIAHPEYRMDVIGCLSAQGTPSRHGERQLAELGTLEQLEQVARARGVGRVVVAAREIDEGELERALRRCRALSLKISMLPRLADVLGPGVEIDDIEGVTVLGLNPPWLPRSSRALKRAMDLTIAGSFLILASPFLLAIAFAVKLDSPGPVLFAQERVGKGGRHFRVFKFRTMVPDAELRRVELVARSGDPNWLKLEHDPRITHVGRRLRRFSLDELPQLWNVVRGEMSMVGPRPLIPIEDERVTSWARGRLDLTPGITGYWQVLGRTRIPFEEMVKLDYLYVMNWSLWEDVRLILKTLPVVIGGRGAN
jgi:exopolysaccharide biosynthesis polyprenyl glycosylphosphotransferase